MFSIFSMIKKCFPNGAGQGRRGLGPILKPCKSSKSLVFGCCPCCNVIALRSLPPFLFPLGIGLHEGEGRPIPTPSKKVNPNPPRCGAAFPFGVVLFSPSSRLGRAPPPPFLVVLPPLLLLVGPPPFCVVLPFSSSSCPSWGREWATPRPSEIEQTKMDNEQKHGKTRETNKKHMQRQKIRKIKRKKEKTFK